MAHLDGGTDWLAIAPDAHRSAPTKWATAPQTSRRTSLVSGLRRICPSLRASVSIHPPPSRFTASRSAIAIKKVVILQRRGWLKTASPPIG